MKFKIGLVAAAVALVASTAFATTAGDEERKSLQILNDVSTAANHYAQFTIFDDVSASLQNGVVTLTGKVTMPYKGDEIAKRVAKVDGVQHVVNRLEVLPVSQFDDQLRRQIARAIYGNANFWNYGAMANPPIHIIVEHGHVTLTGVVQSEVDRALARSLATRFGVMSLTNKLKTNAEVEALLEKIA